MNDNIFIQTTQPGLVPSTSGLGNSSAASNNTESHTSPQQGNGDQNQDEGTEDLSCISNTMLIILSQFLLH